MRRIVIMVILVARCLSVFKMQSKLRIVVLAACVCLLLSSCNYTDKGTQEDLFFAWTEGYLASPIEEEQQLALTFFCEGQNSPADMLSVCNASLKDISENDISLEYYIDQIDSEEQGYLSYAVYFTYTPHKTGQYITDSVVFDFTDGGQWVCPFGEIVFDIGVVETAAINTWESEVASSNPDEFPYNYVLNNEHMKLTAIQIGTNNIIKNADGIELSGRIPLKGVYDAPVIIIKSKLEVDYQGSTLVSYGKGCYCGAVNASNSILEASLAHWQANNSQ